VFRTVISIDIIQGNFIEISGKSGLLKSIKTLFFLPAFTIQWLILDKNVCKFPAFFLKIFAVGQKKIPEQKTSPDGET